jgi:hypothetical protein
MNGASTGRDVPVDVPHVVTRLVLPEIEKVRADPAENRPVVPLQAAVEATDDPPPRRGEAARRLGAGSGCRLVNIARDGAAVGHPL